MSQKTLKKKHFKTWVLLSSISTAEDINDTTHVESEEWS